MDAVLVPKVHTKENPKEEQEKKLLRVMTHH
jgi:hypothetical protein